MPNRVRHTSRLFLFGDWSLNVDTMRQIDYWVGVPMCWLSTLLKPVLRLFQAKAFPPRNVLLIELSEMGSAILVDPAMRRMRVDGANLFFVIFAGNRVSLELLGTVPGENIFTIRSDSIGHLLWDTLRFLAWTRSRKIDTVIDLELFSRFTALLAGWSGAGSVVGFHRFHNEGLYRGNLLTRRVPYNPHIHITRNFFSLVHAAWSAVQENPPARLKLPEQSLTLARAKVDTAALQRVNGILQVKVGWDGKRPLVLLNANASDLLPQRRWPRNRFAQLARTIARHYGDALVLFTGSPGEREGLDLVVAEANDPSCFNIAGDIAFHDLIALYHMSVVMVTNDSGPAHFASVTRMPTIVLFGPETPALYGSLGSSVPVYAGLNCSPCVSAWNHRKTPCTDNSCLQAISVDEVFALVQAHMDDRS